MCHSDNLRIYVSLHKDSGTFEWLVVQELVDNCCLLEHDELSNYWNGPSELAQFLTTWTRQRMAEPSSSQ